MRKLFSILIICFLLTSCNDGDIIDIELDFEDGTVELCDNLNTTYLLYNIKEDPNESLTLLFPISTANKLIFNPETSGYEKELTINSSTIRFNYRTYTGNPELVICEELPDAGVDIINDYEAVSGAKANFLSTFIDDDNDGIPTVDENADPNNDGNYDDAQDSDSDGIPDYIDADDDNDNVPTKNEDEDLDEDGNPYTNPWDTDGDGTPNYLDTDDDGDGVLTIYENEDGADELIGSLSLIDDFAEGSSIPRYLDNTATDEYINDALNPNKYERTVSIDITIENSSIEVLSIDVINFGTFTYAIELPEE